MLRNCILYIYIYISLYLVLFVDCKLNFKVIIGVLVRNKAFALPYFFHYLENLNYDKQFIGITIYEDHSFDNSSVIVSKWCEGNSTIFKYAFVDCEYDLTGSEYDGERSSVEWHRKRMDNVIFLREKILTKSKRLWADYLFMVDSDVILTNKNTLLYLIQLTVKKSLGVISPVLNCTNLPFYSNFWGDLTEKGFYKRSANYVEIRNRLIQGTFHVPVAHSALLFNLNHIDSRKLSFVKHQSHRHLNDDIVNFALTAKLENVSIYVNNERIFGYIPSPVTGDNQSYSKEKSLFDEMKFDFGIYFNYNFPEFLKISNRLIEHSEINTTVNIHLNIDKTIVINLQRRKNRRNIMEYLLKSVGVDFEVFEAFDGQLLSLNDLEVRSIQQLQGYRDPYFNRSLKLGEVGCFLSHYAVWEKIIASNLSRVMVLEDDIKFKPNFRAELARLLQEADSLRPDWEFLYLGRKIMSKQETFLADSHWLLEPHYSYRTSGYVLTGGGAARLLAERPLTRMIALDEYLPIMYGHTPHLAWKRQFQSSGTLRALACYPVLVQPTHFFGDLGYHSDTELSNFAF